MNRTNVLLWGLMVLVASGAWAQEPRIVEYAKKLSAAYAKDGVVVQTGTGPRPGSPRSCGSIPTKPTTAAGPFSCRT